MIVVDASAAIEALLRSTSGDRIAARLLASSAGINAPHLIDIEVAHALRRLAAKAEITSERGREMLSLLAGLPIRRHAHSRFLPRVWELRANVTAYDAIYVALAETLDAPLLTRDRHLARAVGGLVKIELV